MTVAAPPVPPVHENGMNGSVSSHHVNMSLPRFHPIAMNPGQPGPTEAMMHGHQPYRHFPPPPMQEQAPSMPPGPPGPPTPNLASIDHIEARLRQLEHEEAARMAARSHLLAIRKREDEEFRRMTESAEVEEEELRRQRKRLKRESMGLYNSSVESPPLRPTPPRRLSETNAATTLAFLQQQKPQEPRNIAPPPPPQAHIPQPPHPQHMHHDSTGNGSIRRKQKYTIKNVEAWGERHGRPAAHDPTGRALWKRPSDGSLVYLTCPVAGCGKADFVTLHGFMCHLTKKHKDRSLGSQSRALEVCGVVYDPAAPLPPVSTRHRASTEESRVESAPTDPEVYPQDNEYYTGSDDESPGHSVVKTEATDRPLPPPGALLTPAEEQPPVAAPAPPKMNSSTRQSISSIIDREPETGPALQEHDHSPLPPLYNTISKMEPTTPEEAELKARELKLKGELGENKENTGEINTAQV